MSYVTRIATPTERTTKVALLRSRGSHALADHIESGRTRFEIREEAPTTSPVTKSGPSAPVAPVFTFLEKANADGTMSVVKLDANGREVSRIEGSPAETDFMGQPLLAPVLKIARLEDRKTEGNDFARAVDAFDDADELEIA